MRRKTKNPDEKLPLFACERICAEGRNFARLVERLRAENIRLMSISRPSFNEIRFTICEKDKQKTFAILQEMCYNYRVSGVGGAKTFLSALTRRIGALVAAVVFTAGAAVMSSRVWRVSIEGNSRVETAVIERSLREAGVRIGMAASSVDADKTAAFLRGTDGIAESTVEVIGTTLSVKVLESKDYIPPHESRETIVSRYDAEITRVVVRSGTSAVKVGDRVAKNAELIRPYSIGSSGEVLDETAADGEVYGKVAFTTTTYLPETEIYFERTGKKKVYTTVSIFGKSWGKAAPKGDTETFSETMCFLPIRLSRTVWYETEMRTRETDIEGRVERLKREALLENVIKAGGSEIDTAVTVTAADGGLVRVNIYILAEVLLNS